MHIQIQITSMMEHGCWASSAAAQLALGPECWVSVGSGQLAVLSRANLAQGQCCKLQSFMEPVMPHPCIRNAGCRFRGFCPIPYSTAQTRPFSPKEYTLKYSNGQVIYTPSPPSVSELDFVMIILNITPHKNTFCARGKVLLGTGTDSSQE